MKGRPAENNFDEMLVPGEVTAWRTQKPVPNIMTPGDKVFIWASSPWRRLIGVAEFESPVPQKDADGNNRFRLRYLTRPLAVPLGIGPLRRDRVLNEEGMPSFLKSGAAGTIFRLTMAQGERIAALLGEANPNISLASRDPDLHSSDLADPPQRIATTINRVIRDTAKSLSLKTLYEHQCQVCRQTIPVTTTTFYSETHHIRPLGEPHNGADEHQNMIVLCPTHHAMFDLSIPRFVSASEVAIYGSRYTLLLRHELSSSSIDYHNRLFSDRKRDALNASSVSGLTFQQTTAVQLGRYEERGA